MFALALHRDSFAWSEWVLYPDFLGGWLLFGAVFMLAVAYTLLFDWVDAGATTGSLEADT